jgi:hypothetical protein
VVEVGDDGSVEGVDVLGELVVDEPSGVDVGVVASGDESSGPESSVMVLSVTLSGVVEETSGTVGPVVVTSVELGDVPSVGATIAGVTITVGALFVAVAARPRSDAWAGSSTRCAGTLEG